MVNSILARKDSLDAEITKESQIQITRNFITEFKNNNEKIVTL